MTVYRTVGDCLDAGVTWDQFYSAPCDGEPVFATPEEAEAARDQEMADWAGQGEQ